MYSQVLINISNPEDYRFFKRVFAAPNAKACRVDFVANNAIMFVYLKLKGETVFMPRRGQGRSCREDNFSILTGRLTYAQACRVYSGFFDFIEREQPKHGWDLYILPSGRLASQSALADYARANGIDLLYTGYGNIGNKTFADPQGTDMQSYLYQHVEVLDEFSVDLEAFRAWKRDYTAARMKKHVIGQARKLDLKTVFQKFVQVMSCRVEAILGYAGENAYGFDELNKLKKADDVALDAMDWETPYLFFPMQVSTDAQIILNYHKESVIDGLKDAIAMAREKGLKLVIKPHPAEINQAIPSILSKLRQEHGFLIVNENTFQLLDRAVEAVTINSTVGLEAKLLDKPVTFLGNTFYAQFSERRLAAYIGHYLVDEDYFQDTPFSEANFAKLMDRARLHVTDRSEVARKKSEVA
ncbi:capsular polysaccharide export protein, LipB/KpsS family [Salinicola rhizosphaerae]|uniref:Capsular biosynthesis protein n=1 Tax=Salinicola rhizosphaerae TaxID=1443141 RepID=A0ABQ3DP04_9GAMM|nr:hypothetical protein [Salinicola rhizosphaerae]GHB09880.1 hypothetical protein GCM10009038_04420 [Salinicola rhizosphaerae]